jgi:hypothetical protein
MRKWVFALLIAACGTSYYEPPNEPSALTSPHPPSEVRAAILRAFADKHFQPDSEDVGRITGHYDRGATSIRVAVEYSDARYTMRYMDSRGYKTTTEGQIVLVDAKANKVLTMLKSAIDVEIGMPTKDADQNERAYQAMLQQHQVAQPQPSAQATTTQGTGVQPVRIALPQGK